MNISTKKLSKKSVFGVLFLLVLPLFFAALSIIVRQINGTYWLGNNSDPEYAYLLNALNITQLKSLGHTDHPGTPVQISGGLILQAIFTIQSLIGSVSSNIVEAVLRNPEFYLQAINTFFLLLTTLSLICLGLITFFLSQNLFLSLLLQLSPFVWTSLIQSTRVSPEPLLFCLTQILVIFLVFYLYSDSEKKIKFSLALGALLGFGIATKVTFFPLGLVILLLPGWRQKGVAAVASIMTFFLATLPIVLQYSRVFDWLTSIAIHTERYGQGDKGVIDLSTFPSTFISLLGQDSFFFYFLGFSALLFLIITFWFLSPLLKQANYQDTLNFASVKKFYRCFACIMLITLVQLLLTLKHPAVHYLIPAMGLISLLALLQVNLAGAILTPLLRGKVRKSFTLLLITIYLILVANNVYHHILQHNKRSLSYHSNIENILKVVKKNYRECILINYYRSSGQEYALKFGNDFANSEYSSLLQSIYPDGRFYNIWSKKYYSFSEELKFDSLIDKQCIIFQGSPLTEDNFPLDSITTRNIKLYPIVEGSEEAAYLVISQEDHQH